MKLQIKYSGETPSNSIYQKLQNEDKILLAFSFINTSQEDGIYSRVIFGVVQSHIDNLSEEILQSGIQNRKYFTNTNPPRGGIYKMTPEGYSRLKELKYTVQGNKLSKSSFFQFTREIRTTKYSIIMNPMKHEYSPKINGEEFTKIEIEKFLSNKNLRTKSGSTRVRLLNWILQENYSWRIYEEFYEEEEAFKEGKVNYKNHKFIERNKAVIDLLKSDRIQNDPNLKCEICSFSFKTKYGKELGHGYIEAHHIKPLSSINKETITKLEDLILVCSNCHRMLHRILNRRPGEDSINILKSIIEN